MELCFVLPAVFQRKGKNGEYTKLFDAFDSEIQKKIVMLANLDLEEKPLLLSYWSENDWYLITDSRLFIQQENSSLKIVLFSEMSQVSASFRESTKFGCGKKLSVLTLSKFDGKTVVLRVENGVPFYGILNVLQTISMRNQE